MITLEELKEQIKNKIITLPDGVTAEELLPYLNKSGKAYERIKSSLDEPIYQEITKTCLNCKTQYEGEQKYYFGYEGDYLNINMLACPMCYKDNLESYFSNVYNFKLVKVIFLLGEIDG